MRQRRSSKSYGVAVCLGATLGFLGAELFYIGRPWLGVADLTLLGLAIYYFAVGQPLFGFLFGGLAYVHSLYTTFMLLTGAMTDGSGAYICYPGQRLAGENTDV